jgi:hypothetical protein
MIPAHPSFAAARFGAPRAALDSSSGRAAAGPTHMSNMPPLAAPVQSMFLEEDCHGFI